MKSKRSLRKLNTKSKLYWFHKDRSRDLRDDYVQPKNVKPKQGGKG